MLIDQTKLTKSEWEHIERPISDEERSIVKLIVAGYHDVNVTSNPTTSLLAYLKVANEPEMHEYLYVHYLQPKLDSLSLQSERRKLGKKSIKKADKIRLQNVAHIPSDVYEFVLIDMLHKMRKRRTFYYYTLRMITAYDVPLKNPLLIDYVRSLLCEEIPIRSLLLEADTLIEQNDHLRKSASLSLYAHQKELFTMAKRACPKLVLYVAPTGTGKTLSPIGLSEEHKIIFVCAARHVGLSLARTAVSMKKKVAFAFGCSGPEEIRLHYNAAKKYTINRRTGGIGKVDHSVGDDVEIMITDVKSYLPAMNYMLAFNEASRIIMYWDEPTITLDYESHPFHEVIHDNWRRNEIPNVVLSSATLPSRDELGATMSDFTRRFSKPDCDAICHEIVSHDCRRSIQLLDSAGRVAMPHFMSNDYEQIRTIIRHCDTYKTLYRYLDLHEASRFILAVQDRLVSDDHRVEHHFDGIESVTMERIKVCYFDTLRHVCPDRWTEIYDELVGQRTPIHESTIHVVTTDAHTLTNGPTIFLADDVHKIARFYLQRAKIPGSVTQSIRRSIKINVQIEEKIVTLQKRLEDGTSKEENKERLSSEMQRIQKQIEQLEKTFRNVSLDPMFVPNTKTHLERHHVRTFKNGVPFSCELNESTVSEIMQLDDVEDTWKLLLLMGIGVFAEHTHPRYTEIMKELAHTQKLYLIIASTDYIYGTNYQFCHGYIAKDLCEMTQEKCIQALGRIGRNNARQHYTVRFRDDQLIASLFAPSTNRCEANNMTRFLS